VLRGARGAAMTIELEIRNGDESWESVAPLFKAVWTDIKRDASWREIKWANADLRVLLEAGDEIACHVGLYFRNVTWNGVTMHIGGIGGVSTHPEARRKGYASVALNAAVQAMRDRQDVQFVLLFCEPHNAAFYQARGWHPFAGEIFVEQPQGRVRFTEMAPYVFDIKRAPRRGTIDLLGLPW
jgi:aminoglycoside 2'-N-acetyltransferase I